MLLPFSRERSLPVCEGTTTPELKGATRLVLQSPETTVVTLVVAFLAIAATQRRLRGGPVQVVSSTVGAHTMATPVEVIGERINIEGLVVFKKPAPA